MDNKTSIPVPDHKSVMYDDIAKEVLEYAGIKTKFDNETLRLLGQAVCGWGHVPVRKTCPCEFGFHCNPEHPCGCSIGYSSRPCTRCCKGGSEEQQHHMAARIVSREADAATEISRLKKLVALLPKLATEVKERRAEKQQDCSSDPCPVCTAACETDESLDEAGFQSNTPLDEIINLFQK